MKKLFSFAVVLFLLFAVGCSREDNGLHGKAEAGEQIKFTATIGSTYAATKAPATSFRISDTRFSGTITPITASSYVEDIAWTQEDVITIAEALKQQLTSDYEVDPSGQLSLAAGVGLRWFDGEHRFLAVYPSIDKLGALTSDVTFGNSNTSYQMNIPIAVDPMPTTQYCYKWDQDNGIRPYKGQDGATKNELYYGPNMRYARMTASSKVDALQPQGVELVFYPQFSSVEVKLLKPDDMSGGHVKLVGARLTAGSGAATDADLSGTPAISQPSASGTTMEVKSSADRATVAYASNGSKHNYIDLKFKDSESSADTSSPELNESTPLSFTFLLLPVDVTQLELTLTLDIDGYQVFRTLKLKNADGWVPLAAGKKLTISNLQAPAVDVTPLTIEPLPSVTGETKITIRNPKGLSYKWSYDGINWETWTSEKGTTFTIPVASGQAVSLYQANNVALGGAAGRDNNPGLIQFDDPCYAYGNVMSLAGFANKMNATLQFAALFKDNTNLRTHSEKPILLPATTLAESCYSYMFYGCTNLETAPSLPATTLATKCCYGMFWNCTSLETAPSTLPATTLVDDCYYRMFSYCTSLKTAPSLPATTLVPSCYNSMFYGCAKLETAPDLPATTLADHCYDAMFSNCTKLETAPDLPATTLADYCYNSMFWNCTSLKTAPSLPATTLKKNCYYAMFWCCTSLETAPSLPATTLAQGCYQDMFEYCSNLNYIECMATDMSATNCLTNWVANVAPTGTFVKHPNAKVAATAAADTWAHPSEHGIPDGWLIAAPITVSESGKKVAFSPGNLQAVIAKDNSADGARWQFADEQYQFPDRTKPYSTNKDDVVDLFMTTQYSDGDFAFGIPVSTRYSLDVNLLTDRIVDWGRNEIYPNSTASIPYPANTYRTPTRDEWLWILHNRPSGAKVGNAEDARFSRVKVENVYGLLIYPDAFQWDETMGTVPNSINDSSPTGWDASSSYSGSNWAALEAAGVVFLPAAGHCDNYGIIRQSNEVGKYWEFWSPFGYRLTNCLFFSGGMIKYGSEEYRNCGLTVRLVRDVN